MSTTLLDGRLVDGDMQASCIILGQPAYAATFTLSRFVRLWIDQDNVRQSSAKPQNDIHVPAAASQSPWLLAFRNSASLARK